MTTMKRKPIDPEDAEDIARFWSVTVTKAKQIEMEKKRVENDWPDLGRYGNIIVNHLCVQADNDYHLLGDNGDNNYQPDTLTGVTRYFSYLLGDTICNYTHRATPEFIAENLLQIDIVLNVINPKFKNDIKILSKFRKVLETWLLDELDPDKELRWYIDHTDYDSPNDRYIQDYDLTMKI